MTRRNRMFPALPLAAAFLILLPASTVLAQDSMQRDVAFKESLARGTQPSEEKRSASRPRREARGSSMSDRARGSAGSRSRRGALD